ncbi:MAG: three-Cys-motif partner protein TcmP [Bacillota bacterium]
MPKGPSSVLWEKEPHTEMKHEILRRYLAAWLPILGSWHGRIGIIDGFAGPGEYVGGEPGSPVIILEAILAHKLKDRFPEIVLLFVEKDTNRARHLEDLLVNRYPVEKTEDGIYYLENKKINLQIIKGEFAPILEEILNDLQEKGALMVPCFGFIDPFGPAGMPMRLIAGFMKHRWSEVFINFPFDKINRFIGVPEYEKTLDEAYGCPDWREIRSLPPGKQRHEKIHELYLSQLHDIAGVNFTLLFTMRDAKNRDLYHLIFGTKHIKGLDEMKQAMWRVDPTGNFQFSDFSYDPNQLKLFPSTPDFNELAVLIWGRFKGRSMRIQEVEEWVITGTKRYASNHVRRALTLLEEQGKVKKFTGVFKPGQGWVKDQPYLRKGAFPEEKNIIIEFSEA